MWGLLGAVFSFLAGVAKNWKRPRDTGEVARDAARITKTTRKQAQEAVDDAENETDRAVRRIDHAERLRDVDREVERAARRANDRLRRG